MLRRDFLQQLALLLAGLITGCGRKADGPVLHGTGQVIIDMHCHVFNASDLPAARFLRQVVLEDYPRQTKARIMGIRDPDVADRMLELALRLMGADKAPSADDEIAFLEKKTRGLEAARSVERARQAAIEDTAAFLVEIDQRRRGGGPETMARTDETAPRSADAAADAKFLDFFAGTDTRVKRLDSGPMSLIEARAASEDAFANRGVVTRHLNWFSLFRLYRHVLVDRLIADSDKQGFKVELLTPALVDYDEWLFQDVTESPLSRQMVVMDRIARRPGGPAVHGYIGFDPLREVAFRARIKDARVSSLATSRQALEEHGFIGVKLYPPMGFKPSGNTGPYPERTKKRLGFIPNRQLDAALDDLYALCVELDAPILAHGYASNEAGPKYAERGDPAYWLPVFKKKKYQDLRVCLAHFGRFDVKSHGRDQMALPQASWEWTLGEYVRDNPGRKIFADISYFSEVLNASPDVRTYIAKCFRQWVDEFDRNVDHVLFGTDWIMLGRESGYEHYIESVNAFLRSECGFGDDICEKIFRSNALRFLPLEQGSKGRQRLLDWYARNNVDPGRLPKPGALAGLFGQ